MSPTFTPTTHIYPPTQPLAHAPLSDEWIPIASCPAAYSPLIFEEAVLTLVNHPEYNSTLILRSDVVSDTRLSSEDEPPLRAPRLGALQATRRIHRVLLPRRPGRDGALEQLCTFYSTFKPDKQCLPVCDQSQDQHQHHEDDSQDAPTDTVILTPLPGPSGLPYYHPAVAHLAMRYLPGSAPLLRIEVLFPEVDSEARKEALKPGSKLARQCTTLLQHLHRYTPSYTPQSAHDRLFSREEYQDLYLAMRAFLESDAGKQETGHEGWTEMVSKWKERTGMDGAKHVYEDVGIACWLMLLWRDTFAPPPIDPPSSAQPSASDSTTEEASRSSDIGHTSCPQEPSIASSPQESNSEAPRWAEWSRPMNGFLDLGCGNGLLTHILLTAGYQGRGVDVRTRPSWQYFPSSTQQNLHVKALDPLEILDPVDLHMNEEGEEQWKDDDWDGVWLIGNHADELTPWLPLLATLLPTSGYASIPCCAWGFDARWERGSALYCPTSDHGGAKTLITEDFISSLHLGGGANSNTTTYAGYRIWLASLHAHVGWKVEVDTLRIGSTRAWAIVGRTRRSPIPAEDHTEQDRAHAIVRSVRERGVFRVRVPEGRAGEGRGH
ncbi:DUF1613-domain-containing protein [Athelia psychrophila]|uniref:tRNA (uracil-O(2)-)-methyltransferase n=1 Tax=Athelia psychrophila TaxID=1759441 RepID=A0A166JLU1_9AGAM|nr:DUF1613-domain-containing protein [Fibularhizoctonia sp. CBS 109695]